MYTAQYQGVFRRMSYLAKVDTKLYDDGFRNFGCSQRGGEKVFTLLRYRMNE